MFFFLQRNQEEEISRLQTVINELNQANTLLKNRLKETDEQAKKLRSELDSVLEQHETLQEQYITLEQKYYY